MFGGNLWWKHNEKGVWFSESDTISVKNITVSIQNILSISYYRNDENI